MCFVCCVDLLFILVIVTIDFFGRLDACTAFGRCYIRHSLLSRIFFLLSSAMLWSSRCFLVCLRVSGGVDMSMSLVNLRTPFL